MCGWHGRVLCDFVTWDISGKKYTVLDSIPLCRESLKLEDIIVLPNLVHFSCYSRHVCVEGQVKQYCMVQV